MITKRQILVLLLVSAVFIGLTGTVSAHTPYKKAIKIKEKGKTVEGKPMIKSGYKTLKKFSKKVVKSVEGIIPPKKAIKSKIKPKRNKPTGKT